MDIVHHVLIGGAGLLLAESHDSGLVGLAFLLGSVFPDLDVLFMLLGKRFYLRHHQEISHSLLLSPLYAYAIALLLLLPMGDLWDWPMVIAALLGIWLHVLLDWLNTFRIALLTPLVKRRFSLDALFFIDAVALLLTASFYLGFVVLEIELVATLYPLLFGLYLGFKYWLRVRLGRRLHAKFIIPSALNPFEFYLLERQGGGYIASLFNVVSGKRRNQKMYPAVEQRYWQMAQQSPLFCDMQQITRCFQITEVAQSESGVVIRAADIAVRNFGGRFAQTELRFSVEGELLDEMAHI